MNSDYNEAAKHQDIERNNSESLENICTKEIIPNQISNQLATLYSQIELAESCLDLLKEEIRGLTIERNRMIGIIQSFSLQIKVNVGGTKYMSTQTTLCRYSKSFLGTMFSGHYALPIDDDGYFFIDRDGAIFDYILEFLRDPENFHLELLPIDIKSKLLKEAQYYGLDQLMFVDSSTYSTNTDEQQHQHQNAHKVVTNSSSTTSTMSMLSTTPSPHTSLPLHQPLHQPISLRATIGGIILLITVTQDTSGMWYFKPNWNIYFNPKTPQIAICCRSCGSAYIENRTSFLFGSHKYIGIKDFINLKPSNVNQQLEANNGNNTEGELVHELWLEEGHNYSISNNSQPGPAVGSCPICRD